MRRKLSLIALILLSAVAGACANPTAPSRDGLVGCKKIVVIGTQTRCADNDQ